MLSAQAHHGAQSGHDKTRSFVASQRGGRDAEEAQLRRKDRLPAKMEPLIKKRERTPLRLLVGVVLTDQRLDLLGEQAADGGVPLGCKSLGLSQRAAVQTDRDARVRDGMNRFGRRVLLLRQSR